MIDITSILNQRIIEPKTKKAQSTSNQQLAVEIAESFNDLKHIGIYMKICKKFPEPYVRHIWKCVKEINVNGNPGAYFTKIIYKNK
jgi:hypothetical protein